MRLFRNHRDSDIQRELRDHLDLEAEDQQHRGLGARDARYAAQRALGNTALIYEETRAVWISRWLENLLQDLRYAVRQLRKSPVFTLTAALTLALGIGANVAVFSIVDTVVLRPLPFPNAERLVSVESRDLRGGPHPTSLSYPTFFDFRSRNQVFDRIVSYRGSGFVYSAADSAVRLNGLIVSWDLFPMLGVQPVLGRGFLPGDEEPGQRSVVLSHGLWQRAFGADPDILRKSINLDGVAFDIIGVAPAGFHFPVDGDTVDVWVTLALDASTDGAQPVTKQRGGRMLSSIALLKPGVSVTQAHSQLDLVAAAIAREHPDSNRNIRSTYVRPALETTVGKARGPLFVLLGAVAAVLLIACANIAGLLLARMGERQREFTLRASIGASRGRLIRQLLTEGLLLSALGCAAGVMAAHVAIRAIASLAGDKIPRIQQAGLDFRVLAFSAGLAVLTSLLFSLAPAWRAARSTASNALQAGSRTTADRTGAFRSALCVSQLALGLVLVTGAGLLTTSFVRLLQRDIGFKPEQVVAFKLSLPGKEYPEARRVALFDQLFQELNRIPGVDSAAMTMPLPLIGNEMTVAFNIDDRPSNPWDRPSSNMAIVTPGFFGALRLPLIRGRGFTETDTETSPRVLVVNRAFAEKFFPGENAVGKRITPGATSGKSGPLTREIVGVVENAKQSVLSAAPDPIYYFPYRQLPWCCGEIVFHSGQAGQDFESTVRSVVRAVDKNLPVRGVRTLDAVLHENIAIPRFLMVLLGGFAGTALLLTVIGLYGVLSYSVALRTREIGIRIALGATRESVLAMVFKRAFLIVAVGVSIGLAASLAGAGVLTRVLFDTQPREPLLIAAACGVVAFASILTASLPARRAAKVDPMIALKYE